MRLNQKKIFSSALAIALSSVMLSLAAVNFAQAQTPSCTVSLDGLSASPTKVSSVTTQITLTTHLTAEGDGCDGYTVRFSLQGVEAGEGIESTNLTGPVDNKTFTAKTTLENVDQTEQASFQVEVLDNNNQVVPGTTETSPSVDLTSGSSGSVDAGKPTSPPKTSTSTSTASSGGGISFNNPIGAANLPQFIISATKILLTLVGMIVVVVIIYGGFVLVTSQGNPEGVKRGKATITWAIVGLVVAVLAFSIVSILQNLLKSGGSSSSTSQSANPPTLPTIQYPTPPASPGVTPPGQIQTPPSGTPPAPGT